MMLAVPGEKDHSSSRVPHPDGLVIVGLTDDPVDAHRRRPHADAGRDRLPARDALVLDGAHRSTRDDVVGSYAGLRPLVAAHTEEEPPSAPPTSPGATSWPAAPAGSSPSSAASSPPTGGWPRTPSTALGLTASALPHPLAAAARGRGPRAELAAVAAPGRLVRRYGTEAVAVAALITEDPAAGSTARAAESACSAPRWSGHCGRRARLPSHDILERRTRLSLVPEDAEAARATRRTAGRALRPASLAGLAPAGAS